MHDYKNPKWQKKRLEILERDEWKCTICGDNEDQLHVHHRYYIKGNDIWDYANESLTTLCESCHDTAHEKDGGNIYEGDEHPKYQMLSRNIDYDMIPEALILYCAVGSPSGAEELLQVLFDIAMEVKRGALTKDELIKKLEEILEGSRV